MLIFKKLYKSEDGAAAIEFAIWVAFALPLFLTSMDFAFYNINRINISKATGEAAMFAFVNRDTVDDTIGTQIENIISSSTGTNTDDITITTSCNGTDQCTDTDRELVCLNSSSVSPEFSSAGSNGEGGLCADGSTPGYYLSVDVRADFNPLFGAIVAPPSEVTRSLTVKLE